MFFHRLDELYSRQGFELSRKRLILFSAISSTSLGLACFLQMYGNLVAGVCGSCAYLV